LEPAGTGHHEVVAKARSPGCFRSDPDGDMTLRRTPCKGVDPPKGKTNRVPHLGPRTAQHVRPPVGCSQRRC